MADIEFHEDGTISVYLDADRGCRLNRPTMGAYRALRTSMVDLNDQIAALSVERNAEVERLAAWERDGSKGKRPATTVTAQIIEDRSEALLEGWWRQTFALLAPESALPDAVDDWPVFMFYGEGILARMLNHWRSVPLPSTAAR